MAKHYFVNKNAQSTGEHEVHAEGCSYMPEILNREDLGYFENCKDAIKKARECYKDVDGCFYCCNECHTK